MKKTLLLCTLLCLILFSACKKDQNLQDQIQDQKNEITPTLKRSCGMEEHSKKLMEDESYRRNHELKFTKLATMSSERSALCNDPTVLPVAIHYQGIGNPDAACLIDLAKLQVEILNKDYTGTNDDIDNWTDNAASSFPGISNGETCVKFCIASKNHPGGYNLSNGDLAITINQTNGDQVNDWSGYINIFIRENLGFLGYSPLGGSGNGDGVVIDAGAFGAGNGCGSVSPQNPYDLGRTLTHELGHYMLLDHIWGNGCGQDDDVADTPDSAQEYYGCPTVGASSCSSTDMHMNYMDYTNDACMYMFSAGQSVRMENYFASSLQNVINNASNVCDDTTDPTDPTCSDGIQNGQETGVDCGGPDCAPCTAAPTCSDGIQNGQETGVDCGGPDCAPCDEPTTCETPTGVDAEALSPNSVRVSWNPVATAQNYRVQIRPFGGNSWISQSSTNTANTFNGLQSNTTYEYRVRARCTDDGRSPFSQIQFVTTPDDDNGGSDCDGTEVSLELVLDDYGSETTWFLVDEQGAVLEEGGPYQDGQDGTLIEADFCLDDGCYYLVVFDEYGDGICCYYGEGSFGLLNSDGNTVASSDGQFGYFDYLDFCVSDGSVDNWGFRTDPRSSERANSNKQKH